VAHGATTTFTVTPATNYTASVTGCGGSLSGTTYTTGAVTAACAVTASFTLNSYTVTATAGANGTISPASADGRPRRHHHLYRHPRHQLHRQRHRLRR
jgi:hypothetical protein